MQYYYNQGRIQLFEKSGGGGQLPKKTVMVGGAPSETFERGWGALGWSPPQICLEVAMRESILSA